MTGRPCAARGLTVAVALARAGAGVLWLTAPGPVAAAFAGRPADPAARLVARVLGGRQLAQTLVSGVRPGYPVLALGVQVDVLHAASMLAAAALLPRYRRAALIDAAVAGGFAAAGTAALAAARQCPATTGPGFDAWRDRCADRVARLTIPGYRSARRVHRAMPNDHIDGRTHP